MERGSQATAPELSREAVIDHFQSSLYPHLAFYIEDVDGDEVILAGTCRSYHTKQLAQNVAARCPGVRQVKNRMDVNAYWA